MAPHSTSTSPSDGNGSNSPHNVSPAQHEEYVRILVLETDDVHPETRDRKGGGFGHVFDELFKKVGKKHDPPLGVETVTKYVVEDGSENAGHVPTVQEIEEMGDIKALLLTGSMWDAHGDQEWIKKLVKLVQDLWRCNPSIRFSGVCFGHQLLCRALGSKVDATPDSVWELAHTAVTLTPVGEQLFRTKSKVHLMQMHSDHVVNAPSASTTSLLSPTDAVHVWGSTDTTEVQGVYIRERLFTTQGHLGLDRDMVHSQVQMRIDAGSIKDEAVAQEALKTADWEHDGEVVAAAVLRFFHGDDKDIE
ncbi:hypothetical protein B0A49_00482 [Cryomyces minteri]|uniref:Glutamine amidotransferase domain-containing protein n=1 Tax=Cryomyces minteri TaxID=331657 RepID=A0A4U0XYG7_9PEZI|nr:hypothetical protein B0A49_00482 [Cryomyces minteri]